MGLISNYDKCERKKREMCLLLFPARGGEDETESR